MTSIREACISELGKVGPFAEEFCSSSKHLKGFDREVFVESWTAIINAGFGTILLLVDGEDIYGAIGGLSYPDMNSGEMTATETFWFVSEVHRGSLSGVKLYKKFEQWARSKGCRHLRMGHMTDLMPEKVKGFYISQGFAEIEVTYSKEL